VEEVRETISWSCPCANRGRRMHLAVFQPPETDYLAPLLVARCQIVWPDARCVRRATDGVRERCCCSQQRRKGWAKNAAEARDERALRLLRGHRWYLPPARSVWGSRDPTGQVRSSQTTTKESGNNNTATTRQTLHKTLYAIDVQLSVGLSLLLRCWISILPLRSPECHLPRRPWIWGRRFC
jgi:hypothetical protein